MAVNHQVSGIQPSQYLTACAQSIGIQRDHNEDTIFSLNTLMASGPDDIPIGIFIVADGMGGHQHGEVASSVATRAVAEYLINHINGLFLGLEPQGESFQEIMANAVAEAQQAVSNRAPGGGTTLTVALAIGSQVTLAHVGDSLAYLISAGGEMHAVTQDHSIVQRLIELGQISEEEARVHPQRNVLYRAVGQLEPLHPDIHTHEFPRPGYLMICSDGLWGVVSERDIFQIIRSSATPMEACQKLVEKANDEGGPDNISVILARYPD